MRPSKGNLIIVSGFSGAGKGTIMKRLVEKYPDSYALSVSATSRSPRPGEEEGREYFFKTKEEFEKMIADDDLLEHACYVGNYYGTPKKYVFDKMEAGIDVILEIEIQGAMQVKKMYPDSLLMFVSTPDAQTLRERLSGRGTETEEVIKNRLCRACEEAMGVENYDYLVINDDLETAVESVHAIAQNERFRIRNNIQFIDNIKNELKSFKEEK
ncbi:MAG: guanylate kinase [Lachnospiraceae bacterium]|nr:guanylate kinase [Lachnospiraceae bacterium]